MFTPTVRRRLPGFGPVLSEKDSETAKGQVACCRHQVWKESMEQGFLPKPMSASHGTSNPSRGTTPLVPGRQSIWGLVCFLRARSGGLGDHHGSKRKVAL